MDEEAQHFYRKLGYRDCGGVKVTTEYIDDLKKKIAMLEEKNQLKDEYLKKMKAEKLK